MTLSEQGVSQGRGRADHQVLCPRDLAERDRDAEEQRARGRKAREEGKKGEREWRRGARVGELASSQRRSLGRRGARERRVSDGA